MMKGTCRRGIGAYTAGTTVSAPTISGISPDLGDVGGGVTVTITGTNLTTTTGVTFGGTAATSVSVLSSTSVTCVSPAKAAGTYDVAITTTGGVATLSSSFESWYPTQITSINAVYDAEAGVTQSGGAVSDWTDQAAVAGTITQGTAANKPRYALQAFGTKHGLLFQPESWLQAGARNAQASGRSLFAIVKWAATDAVSASGANAPMSIIGDSTGGTYGAFGCSGGELCLVNFVAGYNTYVSGGSYNDFAPKMIGVTHDSATGDMKFYNSSSQIGATQNSTYGGSAWDNIGAGLVHIDGFSGLVGAVVIVSDVISGANLTKLSKWSAGKYGTTP